ncbi:MAG TPA: iron-containing redox enzyme family protein [Gammaproteobacteria bacterium]|nr:iron-containing redox enzyme family protein [Gammaproteobacteria bacterium]
MEFFQQLHAATVTERQSFLGIPVIQQTMRGVVALETYQAFLEQAYHHVKHTVPLLMACGGRLPERLNWLRTAVAEYISEEIGHEEWILNDIRATGADAEAVRNGQPDTATELMVAYAYDTVMRNNPVAFFGMVFVLEGASIALAARAASITRESLGLPPQAFSYLTSHGSLDQEHMQFFEKLMNRIDAENDQHAIIHAAKVFYRLYGDIFRELPVVRQTASAV